MKKDFYLYDLKQTQFFLDNGLKVLEIGVGFKGDVYHRFKRDEEAERIFELWRANSPKQHKDV